MRRLFALFLISITAGVVFAQDTPPPPPTPTLAPVLAPSQTPAPTLPPPTPILPTATPLPDVATLLPGADRISQILLAARSDLELLANNTLGAATRPNGWNGSFDIEDPQMALKLRLDLESLADQFLDGQRPPNWFGVQATSAYSIARDIRHDLELLADTLVAPSVRPPNWTGDNPVMRCSRSTQALALLLESRGLLNPVASPTSPTYCADLEAEVSVFAEVNLLDTIVFAPREDAPPPAEEVENPNAPVTIISDTALAYYDRGALESAGIIPQGMAVTPVARSYAQFSRMTLVRGDGFAVFVDYQDTTLDQLTFEALGDVNVIEVNTSCSAAWCVPPAG